MITFEQAKRQYVHRFTMEHVPGWARIPHNGKYYAPQYATDLEWYKNTTFPGDKDHIGGNDHCCSSNETWPLGKGFLDKPFLQDRAQTARPMCSKETALHAMQLLIDALETNQNVDWLENDPVDEFAALKVMAMDAKQKFEAVI